MEHCPYGSVGSLVKEGYGLNEVALRDVASCCLLGMHDLDTLSTNHPLIYPVFARHAA